MKNYTVKKITEIKPENLEDFYKNAFKSRTRIFFYNYKWFYKTHLSDFTPIVILENKKIVGHAGLISDNLILNDKKYNFTWFTDLIVLPSHRKYGAGSQIVKEWMKINNNQITICNDISLKIFKKNNWKICNNIARYIQPVFLYKINISNFFFNEKISDLNLHKLDKNLINKISEIEFKNIKPNKLQIYRDELWFDWRFLQCPFYEDLICFEYKNHYVIAQLFLKPTKKINILYSSTNELSKSKIFELIKSWANQNKIKYIWHISNLINNNSGIVTYILRKKINFAFNTNEKILENYLIEGISNIQGADSDIGHLSLL